MRGFAKFPNALALRLLPVGVLAASHTLAADFSTTPNQPQPTHAQRVTTNKPHVPPWSVSRPPVPSQSQQVTPGGTFSRPQSTFSPQTGTFSRPQSTFAHPGGSYTPLPPIEVTNPHPKHPHRPRPVTLYPQTVIVHNPVIYEPYYVPAETAAPAQATPAPVEPVVQEPPVVIDLPPGATIRKPSPVQTPAPQQSATAPAKPTPSGK
jgi:hypothetical protein